PGPPPQPPSGAAGPRRSAAVRQLGPVPRPARPAPRRWRMTPERGSAPDPRDVDAEFARMLECEGLVLRPGEAPREPAAPEHVSADEEDDSLWTFSADSPSEPPSPESVARSRAAHPSAGRGDPTAGLRGAAGPRELDDEEVLYGDFEPPDPEDRKSTRLNSSHVSISYAVFCL